MAEKRQRLSEAYDTLKEYGFDARGVESTTSWCWDSNRCATNTRTKPDGRASTYDSVLRPAFVAIANALKNVHPKLHGDESTRIKHRDGGR